MSAAWSAPALLPSRVNSPLAIVDKRRDKPGESEVMNVIGDVSGKDCILIDDIIDSGGTLCNAAEALLANGAVSVTAYITHGVLSGGAVARITSSMLKELVITDRRSSRQPPSKPLTISASFRSLISLARRSIARRWNNRCRACSTETAHV